MKKTISAVAAVSILFASATSSYADNSEEIAIGIISGIAGIMLGAALDNGHRQGYVDNYPEDHLEYDGEDFPDEYYDQREEFKTKMQGQRRYARREYVDPGPSAPNDRCRDVLYKKYNPATDRYETLRRYRCW